MDVYVGLFGAGGNMGSMVVLCCCVCMCHLHVLGASHGTLRKCIFGCTQLCRAQHPCDITKSEVSVLPRVERGKG